jgi:DNA-directed RNA polymerase II subunit RPB1
MEASKKVTSIHLGLCTEEDVLSYTVCEITSTDFLEGDQPKYGGLFDCRMGTINKRFACLTCKQTMKECPGHFGRIVLGRPVYYPHFLETVIKILQIVCDKCLTILDPSCIQKFTGKEMKNIFKFTSVYKLCKKKKSCGKCGHVQSKYKRENLNLMRIDDTQSTVLFADKCNDILRKIDPTILTLIGIDPLKVTGLICTILPVAPPCIRPSVMSGHMRSEDDMTFTLNEIIKSNENYKKKFAQSQTQYAAILQYFSDGVVRDNLTDEETIAYKHLQKIHKTKNLLKYIEDTDIIINDYYELLQYNVFTLIDNNIQGLPQAQQRSGRTLKAIKDRLHGKGGRVRNNLQGKRVDFAARTVIDGDPLISLNEVGVPIKIAMNLTYPSVVNTINETWLRELVTNGPNTHPGANFIVLKRYGKEFRKNLEHCKKIILFSFELDNHKRCLCKKTYPTFNYELANWCKSCKQDNMSVSTLLPEDKEKMCVCGKETPTYYYKNEQEQIKSTLCCIECRKDKDMKEVIIVLQYGDIVERHLCDPNEFHNGDMGAFNRQPSLHRMNIMGHIVRVLDYDSFRLNPCATGPYNADFDKLSVENMGA